MSGAHTLESSFAAWLEMLMWTWSGRFIEAAGLSGGASFVEVVNAMASMPYGRTSCRTPEGAMEDWRGTCSTKHMLLALVCHELFPERQIELMHRVYRVTKETAEQLFGAKAAAVVPEEGLVDVHTYATVLQAGERIPIDVTFPRNIPWDGLSPMQLACGPGPDHASGPNPLATKAMLVMEHCDSSLRDPFIAALAGFTQQA